MMKSISLTEQLNIIGADILDRLKESNEPMDEYELFEKTKLKNISEFGWRHALDKLERRGMVLLNDNSKYELVNKKNDER